MINIMSEQNEECVPLKERLLFAISAIPDQTTYQAFSLLVFTYYWTVIGLGDAVYIGFFIWTVWNMINDPILGALAERTKQKGKLGKRRFYLILSIGPLALSMFFLFWVPFQTTSKVPEFAYFLAIIILFEFFYTLFDVNVNSVFPEQFPTEEKRAQTNVYIKGFTVFGIMLAAITILGPQTPKTATVSTLRTLFPIWGIYLGVVTVAFGIPFLLWGIKEKEELDSDFEKRPGFIDTLKITLTNKTFVKFVIANTMIWTTFNTLITIFPLYFEYVVAVPPDLTFIKTASLIAALLVAAIALPFHRWLGKKFGMRNALMITLGVWIVLLVPYFFLTPEMGMFGVILGLIITASQGIGLGGALFYVDIIHGDIIDEDALNYGVKRSGAFYGINALIHRLSTIFTMLIIMVAFSPTNWSGEYSVVAGVNEILAIKVIIFVFPALANLVAIGFFAWYKLHGDRLYKVREEIQKHPKLC